MPNPSIEGTSKGWRPWPPLMSNVSHQGTMKTIAAYLVLVFMQAPRSQSLFLKIWRGIKNFLVNPYMAFLYFVKVVAIPVLQIMRHVHLQPIFQHQHSKFLML